jgi:hypothetical protein
VYNNKRSHPIIVKEGDFVTTNKRRNPKTSTIGNCVVE